jgi:hypothetical protein
MPRTLRRTPAEWRERAALRTSQRLIHRLAIPDDVRVAPMSWSNWLYLSSSNGTIRLGNAEWLRTSLLPDFVRLRELLAPVADRVGVTAWQTFAGQKVVTAEADDFILVLSVKPQQ